MVKTEELRNVTYHECEIVYSLKRKQVKNVNLRIHKDGSIAVSANPLIPVERIDNFVLEKGNFILSAIQKFKSLEETKKPPKHYENGECFQILGRQVFLKVEKSNKNNVYFMDDSLILTVRSFDDYQKREKMILNFLDLNCRSLFLQIMEDLYPLVQKYGVQMPDLKIRNMKTRWGSCSPSNKSITLNKQLLKAPRSSIEYVVLHELCHFIHPNHSKHFYDLVTKLMPDWKVRKALLDQSTSCE